MVECMTSDSVDIEIEVDGNKIYIRPHDVGDHLCLKVLAETGEEVKSAVERICDFARINTLCDLLSTDRREWEIRLGRDVFEANLC